MAASRAGTPPLASVHAFGGKFIFNDRELFLAPVGRMQLGATCVPPREDSGIGGLADANRQLLEVFSGFAGKQYQGVAMAVKDMPRIPSSIRRRIMNLETAYKVMRHFTKEGFDGLLSDIQQQLGSAAASSGPSSACSVPASSSDSELASIPEEEYEPDIKNQHQPAGGTGTANQFLSQKGYRYIRPDNGGEDVFIHRSCITVRGDQTAYLKEGDKVHYETSWDAAKHKHVASSCAGFRIHVQSDAQESQA